MKSTPQTATSNMNEFKMASAFLIVGGVIILGLFGFFAITREIIPQDSLAVGGYGLVGVFAILSGIGLWQLKRWGIYFYLLFFVLRSILRFPDIKGDAYEILRFAFWAVVWLLLGWYMWKRLNET
ncbi:MAG: hypothetical protein HY865_00495 [Chloroflexi bacterium]|nr:hypothetical protein [Chloroflexota bacterium]